MAILLFISLPLWALTGDEALNKFRGRMSSIGRLTGILSIQSGSGETVTGSFKYMAPGKIYVKLSNPGGKTIVSNGRRLWVYDSSSNICGVQDLSGGYSGGIAGITSGYMAIVTSQNSSGYTLKLKNESAAYPEIIIMTDSSFFLRKAVLKDRNGNTMSFSLSNVSFSGNVVKSLFDFNVPANAQVVKNPLNIR